MHVMFRDLLRSVTLLGLCSAAWVLHASPLDWRPMPGVDGHVGAMAVFDAEEGPVLVAAGQFAHAGGVPANNIAYWDGSTWRALGDGVDGQVYALAVHDDGNGAKLYAGGVFATAGGVPSRGIAAWDGEAWSAPAGSGVEAGDFVLALASYDSDGAGPNPANLVAGGVFSSIDGVAADNTAVLTGSTWSEFGGGIAGGVYALQVYNGALYVGGQFDDFRNIMRSVGGGNWAPFASSFLNGSDVVFSMGVYPPSGTPRLYLGGQFFAAGGGLPAHNIASTDGGPGFLALGTAPNDGTNSPVGALASFDDGEATRLYVGGGFGMVGGALASNNIAAWDGAAWSALGSGTDGGVNALLAMPDDARGPSLYVGGFFTHAGGAPAAGIARYARDDSVRLRVVIGGSGAPGSRVASNETPAPLIDCPGVCNATHPATPTPSMTLTAEPAPDTAFGGWSGDCAGGDATLMVTLDQPRRCVASFEPLHTLTVSRSGNGAGSVGSDPAAIDCGSTCNADFVHGTLVTLTATAEQGSSFTGWNGDCSGPAVQTAVALDADRSCDAQFMQVHTLTVANVAGGVVTSAPSGIQCPGSACAADFLDGVEVQLAAAPDAGFRFSHWTGDCAGSAASTTITMWGARTCAPNYVARFSLEVSFSGAGDGYVSSSPAGIDCGLACSAQFDEGITVTLTAQPGAGSYFTGWSGSCSGTEEDAVVVLQQAAQCTANFENQRQLSFTIAGQGRVLVPDAGLDCTSDCSTNVGHDSQLAVSAQAAPGWRFVAWGGDCAFANPGASLNLTADRDLACSASFMPRWTLTVTLTGTGQGSVASDVPGIACAPACSADFDEGTSVALTASAEPGSVFVGWQGACSGNEPVAVVAMTQARSCEARFLPASLIEVAVIGDGDVEMSPSPLLCGLTTTCFAFLAEGAQITLTAVPHAAQRFVTWHVDCSGSDPLHPLTLGPGRTYCVAEFAIEHQVFGSGFED